VAADHDRRPIAAVPMPSDDAVFATRVREQWRGLSRLPIGEAASRLQQRLRPVHPEVHTSVRSDMASYGDTRVLYVYRDARTRRQFSDDWRQEEGTARVVTDRTGTYLEADDAAARLFGVPGEEIIGARAGSFTRPDARIRDAAELWRTLETTGRLHSLAIVARPDGTEEVVEFLTVKDEDGEGRHVTYLRPVVA